jgi:hypothetical protein
MTTLGGRVGLVAAKREAERRRGREREKKRAVERGRKRIGGGR